MSRFYAQITDLGLVVAVSELSGEVNAPNMIEINSQDESLLGKIWNGSTFEDNPDPDVGGEQIGQAIFLAQKALAIKELSASIKFLPENERAIAAILYPEWRAGVAVEIGEFYRWEGTVYEVIQAHTTQAGWEPPNVPALFTAI